jgi:hypothetical protein
MPRVIEVSDEQYDKIMKHAGKLQNKNGKIYSIKEALEDLLKK